MNDNRNDQPSGYMPDDYDRELARLDRAQGVVKTRPALIRYTPLLGVGGSSTYSVTTIREAGEVETEERDGVEVVTKREPATFTVFLEVAKVERLIRIMIPDKVASLIARQRDQLTSQVQRTAARRAAETRKARGYTPTPPPASARRKRKA